MPVNLAHRLSGYTSGGNNCRPPTGNPELTQDKSFLSASDANATDVGDLTQTVINGPMRGNLASTRQVIRLVATVRRHKFGEHTFDKFPFSFRYQRNRCW